MLDEFMEGLRYTYYFLYDRCHNKHQYTPPKLMRRMIHSLILSCDNLIREIFKMAGDAVSCSDMQQCNWSSLSLFNLYLRHLQSKQTVINHYRSVMPWGSNQIVLDPDKACNYRVSIIVSKKNQRTLKGKRVEHA